MKEKELEKAAEKYAYENFECEDYHDGDYFDPIGFAEKSFIAGAEWQKQQITKNAFNAELAKPKKEGEVHLCGTFACGNSGEKVKVVIFKEG